MKRSKSDYVIQTVTNALRVLEAFREDQVLGVTELARRLDLHKNNVFRLLATLEENGYVEQVPGDDRYRLGLGCLELGHAFSRTRSLARHARAALEELARGSGETAHLASLSEFEVVHLDGAQSDRLVLTGLRVGKRLGAHCTALGKVLLACGDPALLERYDREWIAGGDLPQTTSSTISDRDKFFEHLRSVAGQGYALDVEECELGLCCAAAPVHDASGRVVAALSVSGPAFRLRPAELLDRIRPLVVGSAEALSRQLGYTGA